MGWLARAFDPNERKIDPDGSKLDKSLQSIMMSMGVPKSEYMQFGDGNGFGEFVQGVNQFNKVLPNAFAAYKNEHNDVLPFVT